MHQRLKKNLGGTFKNLRKTLGWFLGSLVNWAFDWCLRNEAERTGGKLEFCTSLFNTSEWIYLVSGHGLRTIQLRHLRCRASTDQHVASVVHDASILGWVVFALVRLASLGHVRGFTWYRQWRVGMGRVQHFTGTHEWHKVTAVWHARWVIYVGIFAFIAPQTQRNRTLTPSSPFIPISGEHSLHPVKNRRKV